MEIRTFFDFCAGIGGGRLGLEMAGLECVGFSETSKLAETTYKLLYDTSNERNYGDLRKIDLKSLPYFDLLIAGFPCQSFSVIGRQEGFNDSRGQIIFHLANILYNQKPKCFILENVKGLVTHNNGESLNTILKLLYDSGYYVAYKVLNSMEYGVPHMRQRVYFIGIRKDLVPNIYVYNFPSPLWPTELKDFLIDNYPITEYNLNLFIPYLNNKINQGKYCLDDILAMEGKIIDTRMSDLRIYNGRVPTLRAQRDGIYYVKEGKLFQLTGFEALLLQGFPEDFANKVKHKVSDRHLLMQAGNAMTTHVIRELGISFLKI